LLCACAAFILNAACLNSAARADESGTVESTGTAKLEAAPTLMRVKVGINAQGPNVREALATLKDLREVANDKLRTLGAKAESIHFSDPTVGKAGNPQAQMQAMIQQRLRGGRSKKAAAPTTVTVSTTLSAEWPLAGGTPEAVLIAAGELREKIKAADLASAKSPKAQSAEEEELAEEAATMAPQMYMSDGSEGQPAAPGTPGFTFVAQITEQQRAKLLAEAFEHARQDASRLAAAAGAQLGMLHQLSANGGAGENPYARAWAVYGGMMQDPAAAEHGPLEAVGAEPVRLAYKVLISASFNLKQ
jgi:uncharacterized protein YggE